MIRILISFFIIFEVQAKSVHLSVLNKISTKITPLVVPDENPVHIHDMIIQVGKTRQEKDTFEGDIEYADLTVFLNQGSDEPIILYQGELSSSTRFPPAPIEHPLYDIILDHFED